MDMRRADRGHGDDLSVEEFDTVVLGQDAGLGHGVVFINGEQALLLGKDRHVGLERVVNRCLHHR